MAAMLPCQRMHLAVGELLRQAVEDANSTKATEKEAKDDQVSLPPVPEIQEVLVKDRAPRIHGDIGN